MFHSRKLNNRINSIHERALRLVYRENKATLEEILHKDNSVTVHYKNLQLLATEIFKVRNDIALDIKRESLPTYQISNDEIETERWSGNTGQTGRFTRSTRLRAKLY